MNFTVTNKNGQELQYIIYISIIHICIYTYTHIHICTHVIDICRYYIHTMFKQPCSRALSLEEKEYGWDSYTGHFKIIKVCYLFTIWIILFCFVLFCNYNDLVSELYVYMLRRRVVNYERQYTTNILNSNNSDICSEQLLQTE